MSTTRLAPDLFKAGFETKSNELREHLIAIAVILKEQLNTNPDNAKLKIVLHTCQEKLIPDFNRLADRFNHSFEDLNDGVVQHDLSRELTELRREYENLKLGKLTKQLNVSAQSTNARLFKASIDPDLITPFKQADEQSKAVVSTLVTNAESTLHKIVSNELTPKLRR